LSTRDTTVAVSPGEAVRVAVAAEPLPPSALTAGERAQLDGLATGARRRDWLLGRAALKALLGAGSDTAGLAFPHPSLSLTHAGGFGLAALAGAGPVGTGIDYEPWRASVDSRTARFFLRPAERAAAGTAEDLLRLWTVKEALFKATPGNAGDVLADFEVAEPGRPWGAAAGPRGERLRYASTALPGGVLSVAVCLPGRTHRAAV